MTWDQKDDAANRRLEALLEPGEEVLWTGRKRLCFDQQFNPRLALFASVLLTVFWVGTAVMMVLDWYQYSRLDLVPSFVFQTAIASWMWCFYFSMYGTSRSVLPLSLLCLGVLTCCWVFAAACSLDVWLWNPKANSREVLLPVMRFVAISSLLVVAGWLVLSNGRNGTGRQFLLLTDRRLGFFSPFPLFNANDRAVTIQLDHDSDISIEADTGGTGNLTFVGKWSPSFQFSGPCTIYDVDNVEDLARKLAKVTGVKPTIRNPSGSETEQTVGSR